jgi:hypothetical protein
MQNGPKEYTDYRTKACWNFRNCPIRRKADRITTVSSRAAATPEATRNITASNRIARAGLRAYESLEATYHRREAVKDKK